MSIFQYKAINTDKQVVTGLLDVSSEDMAIDILKEKSLEIISIKEKSVGKEGKFSIVMNRVKVKEVVIFARQFSVLVSANVTLVQALKILVEQTDNLKLKMIISEISDDVDEGSRLSDAFMKHPKLFSPFFINVVKSGETSGKLDSVLNYLADEMEKDYDMQSKIRGAMIYPAFIMVLMTVIGILMMIFIVPKLMESILDTGGELPGPTKVLIWLSAFLTSYWWILVLAVVGVVFGYKAIVKTPKGKLIFDTFVLRVPIFGNLFQKIYLVRFTRSLETLLVGGVSLSKSLGIVAEIVSNQVYKDLILQTRKEVEDGNSISSAFSTSDQVPNMVWQMMSIGEKTGKLDIILSRVTDFYTREINTIVANLMSLMEPIIMVVMGIAVGGMVAAIIMPMYSMASN